MRVRVFGQLTVTDDSGALLPAGELPRRARQVLGVLAARHGRIQSKDALADAVWGTELPGNHVAALEHYVSVIRRRLQPDGNTGTWFIVTRSGGYVFDTARAALDLADLRARVRALDGLAQDSDQRLAVQEEILALAAELPFPEDPYADWAQSARDEVQVAAVNARLHLAAAAQDRDPARALRLAQEAIELDPFLEPGYAAAMRASAALSRPDDALRYFERCKRALDEELGVAPSASLVQLQREILTARHTAPEPVAPVRAVPPPLRRAPALRERFLGRAAELRVLIDPDAPPVVHVVGPVGAGKSAFLAELDRNAPGRVGIGHGPSSVGVLRLDWLRAVLTDLDASPEALAVADSGSERPLRREELQLVAAAFDRPEAVFLAIDDAGDLDAAGVAELAWLSRQCPNLHIVLTYCYPSQIVGRPVSGLGTPVVLRLNPLTPADLEPLGDATVFDRSGGIPALVRAADRPDAIARSVAMQIARLRTRWMNETAWEVLRLTAVLGPLNAGDLALLTRRSSAEMLGCIDMLVHAHLLSEDMTGRVRHRSTLVREAVAEQVSSASSLHLREQLAAAS